MRERIENLTAILETLLAHYGKTMPKPDRSSREQMVTEARTWLNNTADTPEINRYRELAKAQYHQDGETEIDDGAVVSKSDDGGAYVQAWVWVYDPEVK